MKCKFKIIPGIIANSQIEYTVKIFFHPTGYFQEISRINYKIIKIFNHVVVAKLGDYSPRLFKLNPFRIQRSNKIPN